MRMVLDTQVWIDWLVFDDPSTLALRAAAERAEIVIDAACEAELARVLAYPLGRRRLDESARAACLERLRCIARFVDETLPEARRAELPACRDRDDQKFLELALAARADLLVTRDRALLDLARHRRLPFRILAPAAV
jgi:putative PIN family toxin of toxin-antitoxin system